MVLEGELLDGDFVLIEKELAFFQDGNGQGILGAGLFGRGAGTWELDVDAHVFGHGQSVHDEGGQEEKDHIDQRNDLDVGLFPAACCSAAAAACHSG